MIGLTGGLAVGRLRGRGRHIDPGAVDVIGLTTVVAPTMWGSLMVGILALVVAGTAPLETLALPLVSVAMVPLMLRFAYLTARSNRTAPMTSAHRRTR